MTVETKFFGKLHVSGSDIIRFPLGLPGFEQMTEFVCIEEPTLRPLAFLQSSTCVEVCFITAPAEVLSPGYTYSLSTEELEVLKVQQPQGDTAINRLTCVLTLMNEPGKPPAANLLAPIVINPDVHIAVQSVQFGSRYSHQHPVRGPIGAALACS